jgi:divalent metal cation (Fe/Co/Zn/Cd) transporter
MLFSAGGLFALYEGIQKIRHPHHLESVVIAIVVLAVAIVLESFSLRTAVHESQELKGNESWVAFIRHAKVPDLPVVLLEDLAALCGLFFAMLGVVLTWATGDPIWDGIGTAAIGVLLIAVACVLVIETKSLLLGESASPAVQDAIATALVADGVERIIHLRTMHLGPEEVLVAAKIAIAPTASGREIATAIDAAEARVRAAAPTARVIYLEPDLDRNVVG